MNGIDVSTIVTVALGCVSALLAIISGLLAVIVWMLKTYADKISATLEQHDKRLDIVESEQRTAVGAHQTIIDQNKKILEKLATS